MTPSVRRALPALLAAAVALAGPAWVRAQEPAPAARAAEHDQRGRQAYAEGRYDDCITEYTQADALAPSERYAYNIGKCSERAGYLPRAIEAYERYLRLAPAATDRDQIEILVRVLHERDREARGVRLVRVTARPEADVALREGDGWRPLGRSPLEAELPVGPQVLRFTAQGHQPTDVRADVRESGQAVVGVLEALPETPPPPPPPDDLAGWGWGTAGAGAGVLVAAVVLGVLADDRAEEASSLDPATHDRADHSALSAASQDLALGANIAWGVGGAALATGITLLVVDAVQDAPAVTVVPTPGGALASGVVRF